MMTMMMMMHVVINVSLFLISSSSSSLSHFRSRRGLVLIVPLLIHMLSIINNGAVAAAVAPASGIESSPSFGGVNAHLLVMSGDIYESVVTSVVGSSGRGSRPSLGNLLRNNRLLTVQGDLSHKLFQRCTNNDQTSSASLTMTNCSASISSNLKLVSMRLAPNINLNRVKAVCRLIEATFELPLSSVSQDFAATNKRRMRLRSIMIVASSRLISTFRLLCGENLKNVPVFGIDVLKMGQLFETSFLSAATNNQVWNLFYSHFYFIYFLAIFYLRPQFMFNLFISSFLF